MHAQCSRQFGSAGLHNVPLSSMQAASALDRPVCRYNPCLVQALVREVALDLFLVNAAA
jgi:hypothetical protein